MRYDIGTWHIDVPCDIEIYRPFGTGDAELIPHSEYGARFRREATAEEREALIQAAKNGDISVSQVLEFAKQASNDELQQAAPRIVDFLETLPEND